MDGRGLCLLGRRVLRRRHAIGEDRFPGEIDFAGVGNAPHLLPAAGLLAVFVETDTLATRDFSRLKSDAG